MCQRIAKKVDGKVTEVYLRGSLTQLLAIYGVSGALVTRFEYAVGRTPVAMTTGGQTYYLVYDQVGSLRAVVDPSGMIVREITYDSFGNILSETGSAPSVPFGFAGGLHDRDTGLVRFGFRDYDPEVGRWTAKDRNGFTGGTNLYAYVYNEPIGFIDPTGLRALTPEEVKTVQRSIDYLKKNKKYSDFAKELQKKLDKGDIRAKKLGKDKEGFTPYLTKGEFYLDEDYLRGCKGTTFDNIATLSGTLVHEYGHLAQLDPDGGFFRRHFQKFVVNLTKLVPGGRDQYKGWHSAFEIGPYRIGDDAKQQVLNDIFEAAQ